MYLHLSLQNGSTGNATWLRGQKQRWDIKSPQLPNTGPPWFMHTPALVGPTYTTMKALKIQGHQAQPKKAQGEQR